MTIAMVADPLGLIRELNNDPVVEKLFLAVAENPGSGYELAVRNQLTHRETRECLGKLRMLDLVDSLGFDMGGYFCISEHGHRVRNAMMHLDG